MSAAAKVLPSRRSGAAARKTRRRILSGTADEAMITLALFAPLALAQSTARIVGGNPAEEGEWPDAAAVWIGDEVSCTGTLVAPNLVLTAAHCAGNITAVTLGTTDHTEGGETIAVTRTHVYPNSQSTYDVALLELEHASTVTPRPIATPEVLEEYLYDGAPVWIVGYGATDKWGRDYDTVLMEAVSTVTDHDGSELGRGFEPSVSPGGELGAGGDGIDSCFGDSGGPLYLVTEHGHYLVGVTSRGYAEWGPPCGRGGIYVRADAVKEWIEEVSGQQLPLVEPQEEVEGEDVEGEPAEDTPELTPLDEVFEADPWFVTDLAESAADLDRRGEGCLP